MFVDKYVKLKVQDELLLERDCYPETAGARKLFGKSSGLSSLLFQCLVTYESSFL